MAFPHSERVVFRKNPLAQVICQLRFPPVLAIVSREPAEFQDVIRTVYPLYERGTATPAEVAALLTQLQVPSLLPEEVTHKFLTEDRTGEVDLAKDFLAIATSAYKRWEKFDESIRMAKGALERFYSPAFYSRIGLRYRDVIERSKLGLSPEPWNNLVKDSIVGILGDDTVGNHVVSTQTRTVVKLDESGGSMLLQHGLVTLQGGEQVYAIDADFYTEGRKSPGDVLAVLGKFNREAGNFFRWVITPQLRAALEPGPLE